MVKTTVARTLLDYFARQQLRVRAFDTEVPRGTLKRFHPDVTDVVDINHVPDQMRIFDTVNSTDATVSLIDVRAGLLSPTLRALGNIGFIEAAKKGDITFVLFHILGPSIASLDEIVDTAAYLGDAKYFMVKNFINNTYFFEWDEATTAAYFKRIPGAVAITIPKLVEMAAEQVDLASVPFATFIANKKQSGAPASYSFVLRGYVRHWLETISAEYDRVGLTDILEAKESPRPPIGSPHLRIIGPIARYLYTSGLGVPECARDISRGYRMQMHLIAGQANAIVDEVAAVDRTEGRVGVENVGRALLHCRVRK